MDTFQVAENYASKSMSMSMSMSHSLPVVLNLANAYNAGGGVLQGDNAQEESLFRRSTYCRTLLQTMYPMQQNEIIYSPDITVFKDANYNVVKPFHVAAIACAAIRDPVLLNDKYADPHNMEIMYAKICGILSLCIHKGHKVIILGALGCGAFHNPPHVVAALFKDAIQKYGGWFDVIEFAVLGDTNYNIFNNIIGLSCSETMV